MDFTHNEDRRMLSDSLRRYLTDQYPIEARNEAAYASPFHSPAKWAEIAELGILSALLDEAHGGFGGTGFDISVIFEEVGRALCPEPLLASLLGLRILSAYDETDLINAVAEGRKRVAVAIYEPDNYDTLSDLSTTASGSGDQCTLSGRKSVVYGAPGADILLVAAKNANGVGVYVTEEAEVFGYAMIDGGGAGEVTLADTPARCLAEDAEGVIELAMDAGRLALCAEAVGAMDVLHGMTIEYLMQRQQFGQPIALFQALQHRAVDMAVEIEQCRSIVILAASKLETDERARFVAMAKNLAGRAATLVAEEATQLHGGIGMTWEYAGAHYTKRLIMIDHQLGDRFTHMHRLVSGKTEQAA